MMNPASDGTITAVAITDANNAYEVAIPDATKSIKIQTRDGTAFLVGLTEASVDGAGPPGPYWTVRTNGLFEADKLLWNDNHSLWVACGSASKVAEVICFH